MPQKFHGGESVQYARKQYLDQLIRKKDNGRIKIVTGLRRSGKSYLLFTLYRKYLLDSGIEENQIVGLALDEIDNAKYRNPFELNKVIKERMPDKNKRYYVFIDEIQTLRCEVTQSGISQTPSLKPFLPFFCHNTHEK